MSLTEPRPIVTATGAVPSIWFEDLTPGLQIDLGSVVAERAELVEFASRYDPQWYHIDETAAKASAWGGLIASGFWTASAMMRLYVDALLSKAAPDTSPGMEELRWLAAVYEGDRLDVTLSVLEASPSSRGAHLGTVRLQWVARRGDTPVLRMVGRGWFHRRPTEIPQP